eukprot:1160825-Pelagomonas_calceolata.AAC.6
MALEAFPGKEHIWRSAAQLEMSHGSTETVENVLRRAVQYCPQVCACFLCSYTDLFTNGKCGLALSCTNGNVSWLYRDRGERAAALRAVLPTGVRMLLLLGHTIVYEWESWVGAQLRS